MTALKYWKVFLKMDTAKRYKVSVKMYIVVSVVKF